MVLVSAEADEAEPCGCQKGAQTTNMSPGSEPLDQGPTTPDYNAKVSMNKKLSYQACSKESSPAVTRRLAQSRKGCGSHKSGSSKWLWLFQMVMTGMEPDFETHSARDPRNLQFN